MNSIPSVYEVNFDGLVGPTHNYAGLAPGNLASIANAYGVSNPKYAAKQGLAKMRLLHQLGIKQAFLPPHPRPNLNLLKRLGFTGKPAEQIKQARNQAPHLLNACYSASSMWAANAASISSSLDTQDRRVHFTAANLVSNVHRQQEAYFFHHLLQYIFNSEEHFVHHHPLPSSIMMGDEGAANHSRLCKSHNQPGINLFVYGKQALDFQVAPTKFPARQTLEASSSIARLHLLHSDRTVFIQQTPEAIDLGVFHNDVIAVANENVLLIHEQAWVNQKQVFKELQKKVAFPLIIIEIKAKQLSMSEALATYLFNSQVVTLPNHKMALIAPIECQMHQGAADIIQEIIDDSGNPISEVHYLNLRESMRNGGGPACLRLRTLLTESELQAMHPGILISDQRLAQLDHWVERHYRTQLDPADLVDPSLIQESYTALDELCQLLNLGAIYPFQLEKFL